MISIAASAACATGVDVSDADLAEICSSPDIICDDGATGSTQGGSSGSSGSTAGTAGVSGSTSNGGTQSNSGTSGTGGASGSSGTSGNSGSSGNSGASGSAGSGNAPLQPLAAGECLPGTDPVAIIYTEGSDGSVTANQARMTLRVQNTGAAFELTDLTIRYWFTDDGVADFTTCTDCFNIDYASQGGGQSLSGVSVTFGEERGSNYAEIGFASGGSVGPEGVEQVQVRIHTSSYQTLDQSNDFSFSSGGAAISNRNITPYINGVQVGGCVPLPP